ncbi:MAG: hypothetical protein R2852_04580 [Bacteroidia bacterium]
MEFASSRDGNSISVVPNFFSNNDLHTNLISLDSAGISISSVTDDIDGNTRSSSPDIGADEFNSLPINLAVTSLINPVSACELDSQLVQVSIFNYGNSIQKNFPVRLRLNGGNTITKTFTDSIYPGTSKIFQFDGKVNTSSYGAYQFVIWTDDSLEQFRPNDTIIKTIYNYATPSVVV